MRRTKVQRSAQYDARQLATIYYSTQHLANNYVNLTFAESFFGGIWRIATTRADPAPTTTITGAAAENPRTAGNEAALRGTHMRHIRHRHNSACRQIPTEFLMSPRKLSIRLSELICPLLFQFIIVINSAQILSNARLTAPSLIRLRAETSPSQTFALGEVSPS